MTEPEKKLQSLLRQQVLPKEAKDIIDNSTPSPLYKTIFKQAEMYNRAYQLLESKMKETNALSLISPMIMNLCFSIELLMKSFILFEKKEIFNYSELPDNGRDIYGHKYSGLFNKIDQTHQKSILFELSQRMGLPEISESNFKNILVAQNCDNSFKEWRYIFEQSGIKQLNIELMINLNESLGTQLFELIKK